MAIITTVISDLKRRVNPELFRVVGVLLINVFLSLPLTAIYKKINKKWKKILVLIWFKSRMSALPLNFFEEGGALVETGQWLFVSPVNRTHILPLKTFLAVICELGFRNDTWGGKITEYSWPFAVGNLGGNHTPRIWRPNECTILGANGSGQESRGRKSGDALTFPRSRYSPRKHLKYEDAQRPPVHGSPMAFALDDFRGQVLRGSTECPRPGGREHNPQNSVVIGNGWVPIRRVHGIIVWPHPKPI